MKHESWECPGQQTIVNIQRKKDETAFLLNHCNCNQEEEKIEEDADTSETSSKKCLNLEDVSEKTEADMKIILRHKEGKNLTHTYSSQVFD